VGEPMLAHHRLPDRAAQAAVKTRHEPTASPHTRIPLATRLWEA
jgi:hypothetical protein